MRTGTRSGRLLRGVLALTAGVTGGYSVAARADAPRTNVQPRTARVPTTDEVKTALGVNRRLPTTKRTMSAQELAPMVKDLLAEAGAELSAQDWDALRNAFEQRGTIDLERDMFAMPSRTSLSVGSSLNYVEGANAHDPSDEPLA